MSEEKFAGCEELIIVRQLPIIEEQLKVLSDDIDGRLSDALALECNGESVKEIKKVRAAFNKEFSSYEERRKAVKGAIMAPYNAFEESYKKYVGDKFALADGKLKDKISSVETVLKDNKAKEVLAYFEEYAKSCDIDFVEFSRLGINVTLSASLTSLKAAVKTFLDRVADDIALINMQEHKAEILVEYKKSLNCSQAMTAVAVRHEDIRKANEKLEAARALAVKSDEVVAKVEKAASAFSAPVASAPVDSPPVDSGEVLRTAFTVWGTREQLRALKEFLVNGGYRYE